MNKCRKHTLMRCEDDVDVDKIEGELYEKERCRDY